MIMVSQITNVIAQNLSFSTSSNKVVYRKHTASDFKFLVKRGNEEPEVMVCVRGLGIESSNNFVRSSAVSWAETKCSCPKCKSSSLAVRARERAQEKARKNRRSYLIKVKKNFINYKRYLASQDTKLVFDKNAQQYVHKTTNWVEVYKQPSIFNKLTNYIPPIQIVYEDFEYEPSARIPRFGPIANWDYISINSIDSSYEDLAFKSEKFTRLFKGRSSKMDYLQNLLKYYDRLQSVKLWARERMINLSKKQKILLNLVKKNVGKDLDSHVVEAIGQMERNPAGEKATQDCAGITTITNTGVTDHVVPIAECEDKPNWVEMSTSQAIVKQDVVDSRWIPIATKEWNDGHVTGNEIFTCSLPLEFIRLIKDNPIGMKILQHTFLKSNVRIKIKLSSNKFIIGSLIAGFYYSDKFNAEFKNVCSDYRFFYNLPGSEIIKANEANEVDMCVPFKYFKSALTIIGTSDRTLGLDMGVFKIFVFSPLKVGAASTIKSVPITIFACLEDAMFYGVRSRVAFGQMLPTSALAAMALYDRLNKGDTPNRDKPMADVQNTRILPMCSTGLSSGRNGVSLCENLGFEQQSETQHPPGAGTDIDETNLLFIARHWGFLQKMNWKKNDAVGKIVYSCLVNPVSTDMPTRRITINGVSTNFILPTPLASIASCFHLIRGDMEYCFDFICSDFHNGLLRITFIPFNTSATQAEKLGSFVDYVDISTTKRYIRTIPYINDKPWIVRRGLRLDSAQTFEVYGYLEIAVENPLVSVDSVADNVDVLISVRAGENMEFAVPITPGYKPYKGDRHWTEVNIEVVDGYQYYNTGVWHRTGNTMILRYGDGSDHITQFWGDLDQKVVYKCVYPDAVKNSPIMGFVKKTIGTADKQVKTEVKYIVFGYYGDYDYIYGFPLFTDEEAKTYINWAKTQTDKKFYVDLTKLHTAEYTETCFNPKLDTWNLQFNPSVIAVTGHIGNLEATCVDCGVSGFKPSGYGQDFFGEQFLNIKDLCRRFTMYASGVERFPDDHLANMLDIPILPFGCLDKTTQTKSYIDFNSYFSNMFRFGRGSMELSIIIGYSRGNGGIFMVQHRPDILTRNNKSPGPNPGITYLPGYGHTPLSTVVNPNVKIRVPMYSPNNCIILGAPNFEMKDAANLYGLGNVDVFRTSYVNQNDVFHYLVEAALGSDFKFSVYTSMPWCVNSNIVPLHDPLPNFVLCTMIPPQVKKNIRELKIKQTQFEKDMVVVDADGQMFNWLGSSAVKDAGKEIGESAGEGLMNYIQNHFSEIWKSFGAAFDSAKLISINFFSNLMHFLTNPCLTTMCIAVAGIALGCGFVTLQNWASISDMMKKLYEKTIGAMWNNCDEHAPKGQIEEDEDMYDPLTGDYIIKFSSNDKIALVSALVSGIAGAYGLHKYKIAYGELPDVLNMLSMGVTKGMSKANQVFIFFKNHLLMFEKLMRWCFSKLNPLRDQKALVLLASESDLFCKFLDDAIDVLDPALDGVLEHNYLLVTKVFMLSMVAIEVKRKFIRTEALDKIVDLKFKNRRNLLDICDKLIKLRGDLVQKCKCIDVRYEPFVFCLYGSSNLGKSHIINSIVSELMSNIKYNPNDALTYVVTPGKKHMDGARDQPCWVFDDFCQITTPESLSETLSLFFNLKSPATFRPPMAHLDDKAKTFNPLLVALASNKGYPRFSGVVSEVEAFQRRRDVLIQVRLKRGYQKPSTYIRDIQKMEVRQILENYEFLEFAIHVNSYAEHNTPQNELYDFIIPGTNQSKNWLNYNELIMFLKEEHEVYHRAKSMDYIKRCEQIFKFNESVEEDISLLDLTRRYASYVNLLNEECVIDEFKDKEAESFLAMVTRLGKSDLPGDKLLYKNLKMSNSAFQIGSKLRDESKLIQNCKDAAGQMFAWARKEVVRTAAGSSNKYRNEVEELSMQSMVDVHVSDQFRKQAERGKYILKAKPEDKIDPKTISEYICASRDVKSSNFSINYIADIYDMWCKDQKKEPCVHRKLFAPKVDWKAINYVNREHPEEMKDYPEDKCMQFGFFFSQDIFAPNFECENNCLFAQENDKEFPSIYEGILYRFNNSNPHYTDVVNYRSKEIPLSQQVEVEKQIEERKKQVEEIKQLYCNKNTMNKIKEKYLGKHYWITDILGKLGKVLGFMASLYIAKNFVAPAVDKVAGVAGRAIGHTARWIVGPERIIEPKKIEGELYQDKNIKKTPLAKVSPKSLIEGQMSNEMRLGYINKVKQNTFFLVKDGLVGRCIALKERFFLMPLHYHTNFQEKIEQSGNDAIFIRTTDGEKRLQYWQLKIFKLESSEFVLVRFPKKITQFKDILPQIITAKNTANLGMEGFIIEVCINNLCDMEVKETNLRFSYVDSIVKIHDGIDSYNCADRLVTYNFSKNGACMSVLVAESNHFPSIIGFHVAGTDGGQGFAELVVRESFEDFIQEKITAVGQLNYDPETLAEIYVEETEEQLVPFVPNTKSLGRVKPEYRVFNPGNSKLKHSMLYNKFFPSTYDFPLLAPWDKRIDFKFSPMAEGCKYHGQDPLAFEQHYIDAAFEDYNDMMIQNCLPIRQRIGVLDDAEAVLGLPNDGYEPLNLNTSEGFPFVCNRPVGAHNKKWLIDVDYDKRIVQFNPILKKTLEENLGKRKLGKCVPTVFIDCLKDQKMPREKAIIPGKTRIFSTSPVDYTIAVKKYFGDWSASFKKYRMKLEHAVGINVFSREWDFLCRKLLALHNLVGALDYSKFGPTLMYEVSDMFPKMVNNWYNFNTKVNRDKLYEDNLVRLALHEECSKSIHMANNFLYVVTTGNPSGHPLTVEVNCFVNSIYIRVVYIIITKEGDIKLGIMDFRLVICLITYGDDLVITFRADLLQHISLQMFCNVFARYGIKATPASKLDVDAEMLPIDHPNTTFLKGNFVKHPFRNIYIYKLEQRAMQEIMNWATKSDDELSNTIDTCRAFLDESHSYGREYFEDYRVQIIRYFHDIHGPVELNFHSWLTIDNNRYN